MKNIILIKNYSDKSFEIKTYSQNRDLFSSSLQLFKKYKGRFCSLSKTWNITNKYIHSFLQEIKSLGFEIAYNEELKNEIIEKLSSIKNFTVENEPIDFSLSDLKVPPLRGKAPYTAYQLEDIKKGLSTNRFAFFNEQGTGKSYIILSIIEILRKKEKAKYVLYITTASGVYTIKRQFLQFTSIPEEKIVIANKDNRWVFDSNQYEVIICSYRTFLLMSDSYYKRATNKSSSGYRKSLIPINSWKGDDPGIFVLDESHCIANPKARQTKAILMIRDYFKYRYIMTGTPADKEEKYYTQLLFLDESYVHNLNYYQWLQEYAELGTRFSAFQIVGFKKEKKEQLQNIVKSVSVRRLSDEVLILPEHFIKELYCELTDVHKQIYQNFTYNYISTNLNNGRLLARTFINSFPYLILSIDNPKLLLNHDLPETIYRFINSFSFVKDHSKIELLKSVLEENKDKKIVLWSYHPSVLDELENYLNTNNFSTVKIHGQLDDSIKDVEKYKNDVVQKFQNDKNTQILLASIPTLNTAVSLTSASIQIFFDTSFNYTEFNQAIYRVHRIGQNKPVTTYMFLIDKTLDVTRFLNLKHKDFINRKFHTKDYIDLEDMRKMLNGIVD